jgi:hypothetical protein
VLNRKCELIVLIGLSCEGWNPEKFQKAIQLSSAQKREPRENPDGTPIVIPSKAGTQRKFK